MAIWTILLPPDTSAIGNVVADDKAADSISGRSTCLSRALLRIEHTDGIPRFLNMVRKLIFRNATSVGGSLIFAVVGRHYLGATIEAPFRCTLVFMSRFAI